MKRDKPNRLYIVVERGEGGGRSGVERRVGGGRSVSYHPSHVRKSRQKVAAIRNTAARAGGFLGKLVILSLLTEEGLIIGRPLTADKKRVYGYLPPTPLSIGPFNCFQVFFFCGERRLRSLNYLLRIRK